MTDAITPLSEERLREMLAGLDGVTPGPWDGGCVNLVRSIDGDEAIPIFETREPWKKHRRTSTVMKQEWHNRHHVARCDPDTIRALITELLALRAAGQGGATVRPLEWSKTSYGTPEAVNLLGVYRINESFSGGYTVSKGSLVLRDTDGRSNFPSLDAAKAAAFEHYRTAILSTLGAKP